MRTYNKIYFSILMALIVTLVVLLSILISKLQNPAEAAESLSIEIELDSSNEPNELAQRVVRGWGKIPKQNFCPHCGGSSYTRFCTICKKERGNLPFIGVYCPKCEPEGKYASQTSDVTEICGKCGGAKTWKYIYEDWQTGPKEVTQKPIGMVSWFNDRATLYFDQMEGVLKFEGNFDVAATALFENYLKPLVDDYIRHERAKLSKQQLSKTTEPTEPIDLNIPLLLSRIPRPNEKWLSKYEDNMDTALVFNTRALWYVVKSQQSQINELKKEFEKAKNEFIP